MSYYYYICDTISVYRVLVMYKSHRHTNKHLKLCNELVKADVQLTWCKGTLIAFGSEHTNEIKTHSSKVRQKSTLTVSHKYNRRDAPKTRKHAWFGICSEPSVANPSP